jgi:hypothetical protein
MPTEFDSELRDTNRSVVLDLSHEHRPLIVAFGGIGGGLNIPPFEFFHLTKDLDINKIFVRDLGQSWYHSGLPGISHDINGTASYLKEKIKERGIQRVVLVGNSMGGYAAIVFGVLIGADLVHAFGPHTLLKDRRLVRTRERIDYLHQNFGSEYFDLKKLIRRHRPSGCIHIHFGGRDDLDIEHALHIRSCKNVVLHFYPNCGHDLVKQLRDSGRLSEMLIASLARTHRFDTCTDNNSIHSWVSKLFGGQKRY